MSDADISGALGRANAAIGGLATAVSASLRAAEVREREAARRERAAAAAITDGEKRVADLKHALEQERSNKDSAEYRRGYLAGRSAARRGDDIDADEAVRRRRVRAVRG